MQELIKALIKAKQSFKTVVKNTKAFNYKYAQLDQVLEAIDEALSDNGLVVVQEPYGGEDLLGITTTLWHESGEKIESAFRTKLFKADCQAVGSQLTYYRRYALLAMMGLAPEDDDGQATLPKNHRNAPQPVIDPAKNQVIAQIKDLSAIITNGCSKEEKLEFMHNQLEVENFNDLMKLSVDKLTNMKASLELIAQVQK